MMKHLGYRIFVTLLLVFVVGVTVTGLILSGPPSQERARRIDQQRANDLSSLTYSIDQYVNEVGGLPASLADLSRLQAKGMYIPAQDPVTGQPYEYRALVGDSYEVCATFAAASVDNGPNAARIDPFNQMWKHETGRTCFQRTAQRYPKPTAL